jgi:hypothetical protein
VKNTATVATKMIERAKMANSSMSQSVAIEVHLEVICGVADDRGLRIDGRVPSLRKSLVACLAVF